MDSDDSEGMSQYFRDSEKFFGFPSLEIFIERFPRGLLHQLGFLMKVPTAVELVLKCADGCITVSFFG